MKKMKFSEKQNDIATFMSEDGVTDVMVLTNEQIVTEINEETGEKNTTYEYDGNIFRTYSPISIEDIESNINYYLNYSGDEKPTDEMIEYANKAVDEYTLQLMEEGVI